MTYEQQRISLKKAFDKVGIISSKVTHTMRFTAAQVAQFSGCSEDVIRLHGRWATDRMQGSYFHRLSIGPVRALAGFDHQGGDIWYPPGLLEPPATLSAMVFPELEKWEKYLKDQPDFKETKDYGGLHFLRLLKHLCTVLLQDAAMLTRTDPRLPLFKESPIFESDIFKGYAKELQQCIEVTPEPHIVKLKRVVPEVERAGMSGRFSNLRSIQGFSSSSIYSSLAITFTRY